MSRQSSSWWRWLTTNERVVDRRKKDLGFNARPIVCKPFATFYLRRTDTLNSVGKDNMTIIEKRPDGRRHSAADRRRSERRQCGARRISPSGFRENGKRSGMQRREGDRRGPAPRRMANKGNWEADRVNDRLREMKREGADAIRYTTIQAQVAHMLYEATTPMDQWETGPFDRARVAGGRYNRDGGFKFHVDGMTQWICEKIDEQIKAGHTRGPIIPEKATSYQAELGKILARLDKLEAEKRRTNARFDTTGGRSAEVRKELTDIDHRLQGAAVRFDRINERMDAHGLRIDSIARTNAVIQSRY